MKKENYLDKLFDVLMITIITLIMAGITGMGAFAMSGSVFIASMFGFVSGFITYMFFKVVAVLKELKEESKKTSKKRRLNRKLTHRKNK